MTECPLSLLPSNQCSHCTGSQELVSEPFYEEGLVVKTIQERFEDEDLEALSNETIQAEYRRNNPLSSKQAKLVGLRPWQASAYDVWEEPDDEPSAS